MQRTDPPLVAHVVHSLQLGGMERTLVALLNGFTSQAGRHTLIMLRNAGPFACELPTNVACHALESTGRSRTTALRLRQVIRRLRPDIVHARNPGCWFDATIAALSTRKTQLVLGFHGLDHDRQFSRRQRTTARFAKRIGARFVAVSIASRDKLCNEIGIPKARIRVLQTGIQVERFQGLDRTAARAEFGFRDDAFVVGAVGSLTPVKRHDLLIHATARISDRLPNIRVLIAGDGPLRRNLAELVDRLGIGNNVRFLGFREDVPNVLAALDSYVCCSASEGLSNAMLEAMAARIPIVTTAVGDHARLLTDGISAMIVAPGSPFAIAQTLEALAAKPPLRDRLAHAAARIVSDFELTDARRAYESFYRSLRSGSPPTESSELRLSITPDSA